MNEIGYDITEPLIDNQSQDNSSREIIDQINAKNAKKLAAGLILLFIAYHFYIHSMFGKDTCTWLLSSGRYKGDMGWQPYGCMMHTYSEVDRTHCMKYLKYWEHDNSFVFVGDDRIRDMYLAFVKLFNSPQPDEEDNSIVVSPVYSKSNLTFINEELQLRANFVYSPHVSTAMVDLFYNWKVSEKVPAVIVVGSAISTIKQINGSNIEENLDDYMKSLLLLTHPVDSICKKKSHVLWVLEAPVNEDNLNVSNKAITNKIIDEFNEVAMKAFKYSCVQLWSSSRLIAQGRINEMLDGLEVSPKALDTDAQILLNMYCNDHMNHSDGSCCATMEPYTYLQVIVFAVCTICVMCGTALFLFQNQKSTSRYNSSFYTVTISLTKLSLIMAYFYLCDRTDFFMKQNKYYSRVSFWLPLGYIFTLGLFFTEDSRHTKVLNRDQTDEWKGWMQIVILIYRMTGATEVMPIYNHISMLASAYLFLTGYGHFFYMWFRSDAGLVRFLQVMFRLNFFVVILCFCMNRPYQFYFFIPVVTFWFTLVYFLMLWLPPRITATSSDGKPFQYIYIIIKIILLFTLVSVLYMSEVFFESVFVMRPWKALFVSTDDDISNWWMIWKTDRFSTLFGTTFALSLLLAQRHGFIDDNNHNNLFSVKVSLIVTFFALLGLTATATYALLEDDPLQFQEVHPYIVFIPVICFILLRNVSGILRNRYSSLFAFFGRISLELFVAHFHIWLTADSNGVLVLIPQYPVLNGLIVSYIYICLCHEVHHITRVLLPYAVPSDWKAAFRNFVIFLILLVPIGINDGMF